MGLTKKKKRKGTSDMKEGKKEYTIIWQHKNIKRYLSAFCLCPFVFDIEEHVSIFIADMNVVVVFFFVRQLLCEGHIS